MKFIIIHGSFKGTKENWLPYLKNNLVTLGQPVIAPEFPIDDWDKVTQGGRKIKPKRQSLGNWFSVFEEKILGQINKDESLCFVGYSLGSLFILRLLEKYDLQPDSAIFVAPFLTKLNTEWQFDTVNQTFYKSDFDFTKLRKLIPISYCVYADNDPFVPLKQMLDFGNKIKSNFIEVKGGKHFTESHGFAEFPLILELCKTRINLIK